jgi:hypothetical protein
MDDEFGAGCSGVERRGNRVNIGMEWASGTQPLVLMPRGGASLVQIDAFSRAFLVLAFKLPVFFGG